MGRFLESGSDGEPHTGLRIP